MSFRVKNHGYAGKFKNIAGSEEIFVSHVLTSTDCGGLTVGKGGDITQRQFDDLLKYDGPAAFRNQPIVTVSDGAKTTGKPVVMFTSNIAGSPFRAAIKASQEEFKMRHAMATAAEIAKFYGFPGLYGYMITLTIPNVSISRLKTAVDELLGRGSKYMRSLYDAARRGTGFTLIGRDGKPAVFLGGMLKMEITGNHDKILAEDKSGVLHPHLHLIILTSRPLDIFLAQVKFYREWVKRNPEKSLSPKAFKIEACYSKDNSAVGTADALQSAVVEAYKYVVKPDLYLYLPKVATKYTTAFFCALFKATKGRQALRSYGILQKARSYMSWLSKNSPELYEAALVGGYEGQSRDLSAVHVPDVYTHLTTVKSGRVIDDRKLTNSEMLGANRSLLEGAVIENAKVGLSCIKWPLNERGMMYRHLLSKTAFMQSQDEFEARLDKWDKSLDCRFSRTYAALQAEKDKEKHDKLSDKLWTLTNKQDDLRTLREALPHDMRRINYTSLKSVGKRRALFEEIKQRRGRVVMDDKINEPVIVFPAKYDSIEKMLCSIYLSTPLQKVRYFPFYICAQYQTWLNTGKIYADREDNGAFNGIHRFNVDQFQRAVDKLCSKSDKPFKLAPTYEKMFV